MFESWYGINIKRPKVEMTIGEMSKGRNNLWSKSPNAEMRKLQSSKRYWYEMSKGRNDFWWSVQISN